MKRGEIWTVARRTKTMQASPGPPSSFKMIASTPPIPLTVCAFTTDETDAPLIRLLVEPGERNGLRESCRLMVDKITTVPKYQAWQAYRAPGR